MTDCYEQIGKITSTFLGFEDHGIMTATLGMDYGGSGQTIGGYPLDKPRSGYINQPNSRFGTAYGMEFVMRVIKACGVESWEAVKGRTVLVLREDDGWNSPVLGVKPLPTERGEEFLFDSIAPEVKA